MSTTPKPIARASTIRRSIAATARYARRLMRYYGYSTDSAARLACEMSPRDCMAALPLWERVWIRLRCEA